MKKRILKTAIIGFGKMGRIRALSVKKRQDVKLIAVCDTNKKNRPGKVAFFENYKKVLSCKPDIVFVCTPNRFLPEIVCFFVQNNVHVFCEKPPGRSKEDVEKMLRAEKRNRGVKLKFGFNHRYHQAVLDAKSIISRGRMGKILWMRGVYGKGGGSRYDKAWRNNRSISGGGILIDQGIHMVDLFRLFAGEFTEVKSMITTLFWPVGVEDNAFALLKSREGQIAFLHSSATQWQYKFLLDIYLERGYVAISGILSSTRNYGRESLKIARCIYDREGYPLPNPEETLSYYEEDHSWDAELEEFVHSVMNDAPVKVGTCSDAYNTMKLIEKIYSSDASWESSRRRRK